MRMSAKTKIVVLHLKELIYTAIFAALGILFVVLLLIMFLPDKEKEEAAAYASTYIPGVYTSSLILNNSAIDIEVVVDENTINSVRLVNLDEAVTTMYPLIEPSFEQLSEQICEKQSLDGITYSDENKYTSTVLLEAISASLEKAAVVSEPDS